DDVLRDLALPAVAVVEKLGLVVIELLAGLDGKLEIGSLDDGVHRARLLAETAIDALHHVDVVAGGATGAVVAPRPRLNGDRLRRADRFAELARDAAFLAIGIAPERMLAPEPRPAMAEFKRIIDRGLRLEEVLHGED